MKISNIARASLHDGPGARTVVYFAACSLACLWCHNPETIEAKPRLMYARSRCALCGACEAVCPNACHRVSADGHEIDFARCKSCGLCVDHCPTLALSLTWREASVEEVFRAAMADEAYYRSTGGGVTLSGGECLMQSEEAFALADALRAKGVHVAAETALNVPKGVALEMAKHIDLALCDIKHIDSAKHRALTGSGNERILENIRALSETDLPLILRTPVIPGLNDDLDNLLGICDFVNALKNPPSACALLPYNNLGESKYAALGQAYALTGVQPQSEANMRKLREAFRARLRADVPLIG